MPAKLIKCTEVFFSQWHFTTKYRFDKRADYSSAGKLNLLNSFTGKMKPADFLGLPGFCFQILESM
jgi:hypothetical protein